MREPAIVEPVHDEWERDKIERICPVATRGTAPVYVEASDVHAIGQRCVTDRGFDASYARPHNNRRVLGTLQPQAGDVLLNSTGTGTIGRSCVFNGEGRFIVDGHVTLLRTNGRADGRWLNAMFRHPLGQQYLERNCYSGSTNQVELSRSKLAAAYVSLPDLPEQQRIAEVLDTLDEAIRKTEGVIGKLRKMKQGLLHDLLTRGLDDNGELRDPDRHPEQFHMTPLGRLPKGWEVAPLRSVAEIVDPNPSHRYPAEVEDGVPIASTENFAGDDGFDLSFSKRVPWRVLDQQNARCAYHPDDVVFARKGRIGFARRYGEDKKVFSHTIVLMKARPGTATRNYVLWLVRSARFFEGIRKRMNSNSGVPTLGVDFLGKVDVPLMDEPEQIRIAAAFEAHDRRLRLEQGELSKLLSLKRGLMDDLLTGRVRVAKLIEKAA